MTVYLPFKSQFRDALLTGQKIMTCRPARMACVGDHFHAFGSRFNVLAVMRVSLGYVARDCWQEEGCTSPETFITVWESLHPGEFAPHQVVWAHIFQKEGGGE